MKNILILGKDSYVGESLKRWLEHYPELYNVSIVSTLNNEWRTADLTDVRTVVDLAGIAHINNITKDMEPLFYSVNRDLTAELGKWAKNAGVEHFIYLSSMNVYGDYCDNITDRTKVNPTSFYGDSKLQGDIGLDELSDERFKVAHVRPPFVYGKGCRGNYNSISKIARKTPVFPNYANKKSMIYIDNLCEFIRLLIEDGQGGVFTPQNKELVSTSDLVAAIAECNGRKIWFTRFFNPAIFCGVKLTRFVRRAFANDNYAPELSDYYDYGYCVVDFKASVRLTENGDL